MKDFFKNTFSTLLALFIFSFTIVLIVVYTVSSFSKEDKVYLMNDSILKIDIDHKILDRVSNNPLESLDLTNISETKNLELKDLLQNIKKAKTHSRIKGIYLKISSIEAGFSQLEEIRNTLLDFRNSGKFIYAFSETYTQESYYLSSVANKIFMSPEGYIELKGISAQVLFYKDLLEKIGVETQIVRSGKYKSAVEPFITNNMSRENREQIERMINSIFHKIKSDISDSRSIKIAVIDSAANHLVLNTSNKAKQLNFIDKICYEDQALDEARKMGSNRFISYDKFSKVDNYFNTSIRNKIAVIYANGAIVSGKGKSDEIGSATISKLIREAASNDNIKSIVIRVNSPGGSALASDIILREIKLARDKKPIVVSMGDYAASGGYYISCYADKIFASSTSITGSIGVFGILVNIEKFLNDKIGVNIDTVNTNKYSDFGSATRPLSNKEKLVLRESIDNIYNQFIYHVSNGRGKSISYIDSIAQGRVWSGKDGLDLGLVDEIGGLDDAIIEAANLAGIDEYRVIYLPKEESLIYEIISKFSSDDIYIPEMIGIDKSFIYQLLDLAKNDFIQTRMPYFIKLD